MATAALAEVLGVAPWRVLLTNGGAEAIAPGAAELGRGRGGPRAFRMMRGGGLIRSSRPARRQTTRTALGVRAGCIGLRNRQS